MSKKILITGASGQLGRAISKKLNDIYEVYPYGKDLNNSIYPALDITCNNTVSKILNIIKPNIIINCAAYTDVDSSEVHKANSHKVNVSGLRNLIKSSSKNTYFIQISSDYIFKGDSGPYIESDKPDPLNYYGRSKLEAENLLVGSQRSSLIIRPNVIYGSDLECKSNFFAWIYNSLINKKNINVVNDQISNPVFLPFLVDIIFKCINLNINGIFHCGSDDYLSRYDFAMKIANIFNLNNKYIMPISTKDLMKRNKSYIARRPMHSGLQTKKIIEYFDVPVCTTDYNLQKIKDIL